MGKANYIDSTKNHVGIREPIFKKLASALLHYVQNFTLKFIPVSE